MSQVSIEVGAADAGLDQRLSDELDRHNHAAVPGPTAVELTVTARRPGDGDVVGGISGWTWQEAAGIQMVWVASAHRGERLGARLLAAFEGAAAARGARRVFVTSFTFQGPGFYERCGYREIFRWDGVPVEGEADVHLRKDLAVG
ncbi:hypothetical protein GCM10009737_26680 [Nocardioides lentus]|uniref:N-acetyltransferase domain-containing protein n=1 Tax=Nocardioides lentus TaxID=338077 RepID=A0ABP5AVK1_9ACTN